MLPNACLCFLLLAATPAWSQLEVVPYQRSSAQPDDDQMRTPPPVSNESYPKLVGSEMRSNYIGAGVLINTAYDDNVIAGADSAPISDTIYSILPTITFNKATVRQHLTLTYSPGVTLYQHTKTLNAANQNGSVDFRYLLNEYTAFNLNDSLQKTSNLFDQLYPPSGTTISGPTQAPTSLVVAPYANLLTNTVNIGLSRQISRDSMIGAGAIGIIMNSNYPNPGQASGFYNSSSYGGSLFYNRRLSEEQYIGVKYEYVKTLVDPANPQSGPAILQTKVQTHTVQVFYTLYLSPTLSLSFSGGPQYFNAVQGDIPSSHSWSPSVAASIGWQRNHSNLVASYSKTITGSNGLAGASATNGVSASWRWQMAPAWTATWAGTYFENTSVTPLFPSANSGGHTVSGTFAVQYSITEYLRAGAGYVHLHQSYKDIPVISEAPDSDRAYLSVSCQFTRSLGR